MNDHVELSKSSAHISAMFDAIAPRYDFLNHALSAGIDRHWRKRAIRSLRLTGRERLLDVCTGTADLAIAARTATPGAAKVVGVDIAAACREMHRVLKPGGALAILEFAIPTQPIVRAAYLSYFRHILPAVGRLVSRHNAAYGYLPESVSAFGSPDQFMEVLRVSRFVDVAAVRMTFGIVCLYT